MSIHNKQGVVNKFPSLLEQNYIAMISFALIPDYCVWEISYSCCKDEISYWIKNKIVRCLINCIINRATSYKTWVHEL